MLIDESRAAPSVANIAKSVPEKIVPNGSSGLLVGITDHGSAITERDKGIGKEARQESARRDLPSRS